MGVNEIIILSRMEGIFISFHVVVKKKEEKKGFEREGFGYG